MGTDSQPVAGDTTNVVPNVTDPSVVDPLAPGSVATTVPGATTTTPTTMTPTEAATLDPGVVTLRRLNRAEYNNTVHDLLGTDLDIAVDFPPDDLVLGFDTIGAALTVSPLHIEMYEQGAARLVAELFARDATDPARTAVLTCDYTADAACPAQILQTFATRAFRRPVDASELTRYLTLIDSVVADAGTVEEGLGLALQALLMAPQFMYRVEGSGVLAPEPLTDHALATRLSYFLWSTTPDAELTQLASAGALQDPTTLTAQADRLLADARSQEFIDNFAGQWLQTRLMASVAPDYDLFPTFNDDLRDAMAGETLQYFAKFLDEGLPARQLLTASFGFANDVLAEHYGLTPPGSPELVEVPLTGAPRLGLLTQASVLTLTSHPNKTSPVKRGKWVLEQLLCSAPPPPPPGVNANLDAEVEQGLTLRESLAVHRTDPTCAACHNVMDAIGLGLENYDAVGAYRESYGDQAIDASGELPGPVAFNGALDMAQALAADPRFDRCVAQQIATYGLGRAISGADDAQWLDEIEANMVAGGGTLGAAISAVISSPIFRMRGVGGNTP